MKLIPIEVQSDINERLASLRQEKVVCFHQFDFFYDRYACLLRQGNQTDHVGEGEQLVSYPSV